MSRRKRTPSASVGRRTSGGEKLHLLTMEHSIDEIQEQKSSTERFHTHYRTNLFILRMSFVSGKSPVGIIYDTRSRELSLDVGADIRLSALQRDLDQAFRAHADSHVGNYYFEEKPPHNALFEIVFTSKHNLARFVNNQMEIRDWIEHDLHKRGARNLKVESLELFLVVTHPKSATKAVLVKEDNIDICMQSCDGSSTFSFSTLFHGESSFPITELDELLRGLDKVVDWFKLGLMFHLPESELEKIRSVHQDVDVCKREMLILCLKRNELTWFGVVSVLQEMNEFRLASELACKYGITLNAIMPKTEDQCKQEGDVTNLTSDDKVTQSDLYAKLQEQLAEKKMLEQVAEKQQSSLLKSEEQIAKLEEEKAKLIELQHEQLGLSASLQKGNLQLQEQIREKDVQLKQEREKCVLLQADLAKTKDSLNLKSAQVEQLEETMRSMQARYKHAKLEEASGYAQEQCEEASGFVQEQVNNRLRAVVLHSQLNPVCLQSCPEASVHSYPELSPQLFFLKIDRTQQQYCIAGTESRCQFIGIGEPPPISQITADLKYKGLSRNNTQLSALDYNYYEVVYTPHERGTHTLEILINGRLTSTTPVTVYPNPKQPLVPTKRIPVDQVPLEVDVDIQGIIWIAHCNRVVRLDPSINEFSTILESPSNGIKSIAVSDNSVFLIDEDHLTKLSRLGEVTKKIGVNDEKRLNVCIVRTLHDCVYVCVSNHAKVFLYDSELESCMNTITLQEVSSITDLAFDRSSDLMYVLSGKQILVVNSSGEKKNNVTCDAVNPIGICTTNGYIYIANNCQRVGHNEGQLIILDQCGTHITSVRRCIDKVCSISAGHDGYIYICNESTLIGDDNEKIIVF